MIVSGKYNYVGPGINQFQANQIIGLQLYFRFIIQNDRMTFLECLKTGYLEDWNLAAFNHNGTKLDRKIADSYSEFTEVAFELLIKIRDKWSARDLVAQLLRSFYRRHESIYISFHGLSKTRIKQRHLGANMSFTAGLGPAFRAATWCWKERFSRERFDLLVKVMLIHDLHKRIEKTNDTFDLPKSSPVPNGSVLSLRMSEQIGVFCDQMEERLILNHDAPVRNLRELLVAGDDFMLFLCLVKIFDRCDKPVLTSLTQTHRDLIQSLEPKSVGRLQDARLPRFFAEIGELACGKQSVQAGLEWAGISVDSLNLPEEMTHVWETRMHYLYMLKLG